MADKIFQILAVLHYPLFWRLIAIGQLHCVAVPLSYFIIPEGLLRADHPGYHDEAGTRQPGGDPLDGHTPGQGIILRNFSWLFAGVFLGHR
jgi:hypothetical protein